MNVNTFCPELSQIISLEVGSIQLKWVQKVLKIIYSTEKTVQLFGQHDSIEFSQYQIEF